MKIQCDVCNKQGASLFCAADEAALCDCCDVRVHRANKLAGKHQRFSLLEPATCKEAPRCDVCQERRAFLFCQEDRAILCRDCDVPIHTANEHTRKHNRFLLTGVKLSMASNGFPDEASPEDQEFVKETTKSSTAAGTGASSVETVVSGDCKSLEGCTSSISEYLIETLPGWHVEDFLDSSPMDGLCKVAENGNTFFSSSFSLFSFRPLYRRPPKVQYQKISESSPSLLFFSEKGFGVYILRDYVQTSDNLHPFLEVAFESDTGFFSGNVVPFGVPQVPQFCPHPAVDSGVLFKEYCTEQINNPKNSRRWTEDFLAVPQISPPSKRQRPVPGEFRRRRQ